MRKLQVFIIFILMSCSASKVIIDYDAEVDFTAFKTYAFYTDIAKDLNELDVKRITKAIDSELEQKGFAESDAPDFYINVISKLTEAGNNNTIGIGVGSGGNNGGFSISGGIPIGGKKLNEEFIIEFVSAKSNEVFWEGILNSAIIEKRKPEEKEIHFQTIIKKILEKYPPQP